MLEHYATMVQNSFNEVNEVMRVQALSAGGPTAFGQSINNNVGEGTISVKQESNLMEGVCANCGQNIFDQYVMRVNERDYHENCLSCAECSTLLSHSCFARNCKYYCRADYERIYAVKCGRCQQKLNRKELVMRTEIPDGPIFHVDCFVCCICSGPLPRGAKYILRHGQPLCKREFPNDHYSINNSQDEDFMDDTRPRDGRRGPKRPRTILTSTQRRQFKAAFELSPKPCRKVREALAKDTGLSVRVVQVWFQNQRAKMKKVHRKSKTEVDSDKEPKEVRKPESPHSDHNVYPGHSGDSLCSSDISIDGTEVGFEIGEGEVLSVGGADGCHQSLHSQHTRIGPEDADGYNTGPEIPSLSQSLHSATHNPIDKLFMMQNSYFNNVDH